MTPLIPYIEIPELVLVPVGALGNGVPASPVSLKPFGTLVATGVYLGGYLAVRYGKRAKLNERALVSFITWVVGLGFVFGHVLDILFYYPERLLQDPWSLLRLWDGLSSFGGFTGALLGAMLWGVVHHSPVLPYADAVASALPVGWVFGRMGCSVAHDHPGVRSELWFAVQYPDGGRFDLGLYEMLLTLPLAAACWWLARRPRPWGFFCSLLCLAYAPVRFGLDFLREPNPAAPVSGHGAIDVRYALLTPAQWACFGLFALGIFLALCFRKSQKAGEPLAPPEPPAKFVRAAQPVARES